MKNRTSLSRTSLTMSILGMSLALASFSLALVPTASPAHGQTGQPAQVQKKRSVEEKAILKQIGSLRQTPDDERARLTKQLALDIRKLPDPGSRLELISYLSHLATEGDFGQDTLQEVGNTLIEAIRAQPADTDPKRLADPYQSLAQYIRYENVTVADPPPALTEVLKQLAETDKEREKVDFTLTDLEGKAWNLKSLRGKIVLVNFWATWCPPCRKELPDLAALHTQFKDQGLVILGITAETAEDVKPFLEKNKLPYPILLDTDNKVATLYGVQGIPRNLIFDRNGKLAAQAIDMRTQKQFLALLAKAGLKPAPAGAGKTASR